MDYIKGLHWRYAVKKMSGESPSKDKIEMLLESVRLTASSYGLQPYRLVIVEDYNLKLQLQKASFDQEKVSESSHMLVFATLNNIDTNFINQFIELNAKQRAKNSEDFDELRKMITKKVDKLTNNNTLDQWAKNQAYIALGSTLSAAASLGIDTCAMEGFETDKYDNILGLKQMGLTAAVVCAVGIRAKNDTHQFEPKVRWEPKDFFIHI